MLACVSTLLSVLFFGFLWFIFSVYIFFGLHIRFFCSWFFQLLFLVRNFFGVYYLLFDRHSPFLCNIILRGVFVKLWYQLC